MATSVKYGTLETDSAAAGHTKRYCNNKRIIITSVVVCLIIIAITIFSIFQFVGDDSSDDTDDLSWINLLSDEFSVEYYAKNIYQPRQMEVISNVNETSTIIYTVGSYWSTPLSSQTAIYALIDYESDCKNDKILRIFAATQYIPTSVQYDTINNCLYITEFSVIYKCPISNEEILFQSKLQNEYLINDQCDVWYEWQYYWHHGWHFTKLHPVDNTLCISYGVPCDSCNDFIFPQGTIGCFNDMDNPNINNMTTYAHGVRDCVGIDFHPQTNDLWFTDHNIDELGDDEPDCELNKISYIGQHFGYPYCHSVGFGDPYLREYNQRQFIVDPEFGDIVNNTCNNQTFTAAIQPLGPHVAPDGLLFYTANMFDHNATGSQYVYQNRSIFIAQHGSWARSQFIGFRVGVVFLGEGEYNSSVIGYDIFADGWLKNVQTGEIYGRPSFLAMLPDGSLLIADDFANVIYRIYNSP